MNKNSSWADYVFAADYSLMPLDAVKEFISKNHHLPGIPSSDTIEKEGVDLGSMQAKMMEKIEELTLYVIDMQAEMERLRIKNQSLEDDLEKVKSGTGK